VSEGLCGAHRPGHFDGVATVVTKLLLQTSADCAVFGENDFQQLQVIRRLVRDLDIGTEIIGGPTAREVDGLALSSRNRRLSPKDRAAAPALFAALRAAGERLRAGETEATVVSDTTARILAAGYTEVEYLEVRRETDLARMASLDAPARLLVAAWPGGVRLIDNLHVSPIR